ncbi:inorganic diphosphatase [Lichenibacterium dinghuense]|uniref:inorganic diphosphatase n=1 Tax=Lichenibacterium dinghuense TaxID=2895977 RepID=UPI001F02DC55|nr:inorganic diphosphatase [Lichenibacterium sp. 6Y81]
MNIDLIPIGRDAPEEFNAVIEVPVGGEPVKYEFDKATGALFVDRFLQTAMRCPGNYGFIPRTLSEDGDPCDVLVLGDHPVMPGAVVAVRPIGVLRMSDENGPDEKVVAVPATRVTRDFERIASIDDLPVSLCERIEHYFAHYKDLEAGKWVTLGGWEGPDAARSMVRAAIDRHGASANKGS